MIFYYMDTHFGTPNFYLPEEVLDESHSTLAEVYIHNALPWGFFPMLIYQDEKIINFCKKKLLLDIDYLCR